MSAITIAWIALPFFVGFCIYLLPKCDRYLTLAITVASLGYGLSRVFNASSFRLQLLDQFGVTLVVDPLSGHFIVTNALVTAAVVLYCWSKGKTAFFYTQLTILHGSINAVFVCADFVSLYVALEVVGIAAFLLIAYPRTNRAIWVGLRYLFVSNTAMLFYLIGAVLVYQANHSFAFSGLGNAPTEAVALIFLGLLTKGGIFISGLWLPMTHSESETPVSAMLSGSVVKTGVFPLVRCALVVEEIGPMLQIFSMGTAILGVAYAISEQDTKRMLAASTISQVGFILAAPAVAGFYALTHGLAKASLFLIAGNLSSRKFQELRRNPMPTTLWLMLAIASLSISGFPLLAGFEAKVFTLKQLLPWQEMVMTAVSVGTAIAFAKFIFLPFTGQLARQIRGQEAIPSLASVGGATAEPTGESTSEINAGFWLAMLLLLDGLIAANTLYYEGYTVSNVIKALITIGLGWLAYFLFMQPWAFFQRWAFQFPKVLEKIEHLIGGMSLILLLLFGMVLA